MNIVFAPCPKCQAYLPPRADNRLELFACPGCGSQVAAATFPALYRPTATGRAGETLLADSDAGCFYHPQKKATVVCDHCGRFLCALCDVAFVGEHLCPPCIAAGRKNARFKELDRQRILYDNVALGLATLPLLVWPFTFVTAPMALFIAMRYWNHPKSIVRGSRLTALLAILIAAAQVLGWVVLIVFLVTG
jgi:DNA-directed RNA polymerase subunit M/transcription elongation factor TFIIS